MHLDRIAQDYSNGVNHGGLWGAKLVTAKHRAVEAAWRVADRALDVAGGFGIFPASGLERMVRDMRLGRIHPANSFLAREIVAKSILGLDLDAQPRWG
jgi:alkylation response protein AidB-like acyl-CoA dehydrogenase